MEIDSNLIKKDKLEAFDILRKALTISAKNINYLIFTILTSLPLFCFLVYYEPFLHRFFLGISQVLNPSNDDDLSYIRSRPFRLSIPTDITTKLNNEFRGGLVQIGLVYLIPLQLLELSTILVIVDLASKTYARQEEEEPPLTLKEMVRKPFDVSRVIGTLDTFVYVVIMSTISLLGLVWLAATYYVVTMFNHDVLVFVWSWVGFVGLMTMYLGWSAVCNMSVVISILEGRYGTNAIASAISYSFGNEWRGFRLMLVFFAWGFLIALVMNGEGFV